MPRPPSRSAPPPPEEGAATASILLVEDVRHFVDLLKNYLRRTTCRVLRARNGSEGIALCRQERPDLVFLDAEMRGTSGIEICRVLKADPLLRGIPIVIVTSGDRQDECRAAGCDGLIIKPVTHEKFLDQVRTFVELLERQEHRIPVSLRVDFKAPTGLYTAFTRDLSPHGTFLKSPRPFAPGTRLRLTIHLPRRSGTLEVDAEVRRVIDAVPGSHLLAGVGVRFVEIPPAVKGALEDFIAERLRGR
jgi:uncharacterized protein (TIGR02266 family)